MVGFQKMRVLDLFSGIGGFSLGLEQTGGFETVAFCEISEFCRDVLRKHWPNVPVYEDVRNLDGGSVGPVDLICGGYPCQPFSVAGKRGGDSDDRHLWPEMLRLVRELRPAWVIGENVDGHISMGIDEVLSDLEQAGYSARPFVIPAVAVDAPHIRKRVWIVAHANCESVREQSRRASAWSGADELGLHGAFGVVADADSQWEQQSRGDLQEGRRRVGDSSSGFFMADAQGERLQGQREGGEAGREDGYVARSRSPGGCGAGPDDVSDTERLQQEGFGSPGRMGRHEQPVPWHEARRWIPEPGVGRVVDGLPNRVDRIAALGNAVVPQLVQRIGFAILAAEFDSIEEMKNETQSGK